VLPSGADVFVGEGESDPVARLIADANAELDRQRTAEAGVIAAKATDIERVQRTKKARAMRHLRRALTLLGYRSPR
jgi:hypothetical protein